MGPGDSKRDGEQDSAPSDEQESNEQWSGADELLSSLGEALRSREGKAAVASVMKAYADDLPRRSARNARATYLAYGLAGVTMIVVGALGYLKILSTETTGVLMGTVVASLFYRQR